MGIPGGRVRGERPGGPAAPADARPPVPVPRAPAGRRRRADCVLWRLAGLGLQLALRRKRCPAPTPSATWSALLRRAAPGAVHVAPEAALARRWPRGRPRRSGLPASCCRSRGQMVAEMQDAGVTIGSHTRTHALLTQESARARARGARRPRAGRWRSGSARPCGTSRIPTAASTRRAVAAVAAAGYRFAYTTCHHRDPRRPAAHDPPPPAVGELLPRRRRGRFSAARDGLPGRRRVRLDGPLRPAPRRGERDRRPGARRP